MLTNLVRDLDDHDLSVLHNRNTQNGLVGVACVNPLQKNVASRATYRDYYAHCSQVASTLDTMQASSRRDRTSYELRISPDGFGGFTFVIAIRVHSFLRFLISFSCSNAT